MIQRIRIVAVPFDRHRAKSLISRLRLRARNRDTDAQDEEELNVLLKHALERSPEPADGNRVWQELTRKVCGPFGAPALEAPSFTSLEFEMMASGGVVQPAPFVLSDRAHGSQHHHEEGESPIWGMLRFVCSGFSHTGRAWMLS
jgi:hypothetical protein